LYLAFTTILMVAQYYVEKRFARGQATLIATGS